MEGLIDLENAADMDRKYFLAFLKALTAIKFKDLFEKVKAAKKAYKTSGYSHGHSHAHEDGDEDDHIDLGNVYT